MRSSDQSTVKAPTSVKSMEKPIKKTLWIENEPTTRQTHLLHQLLNFFAFLCKNVSWNIMPRGQHGRRSKVLQGKQQWNAPRKDAWTLLFTCAKRGCQAQQSQSSLYHVKQLKGSCTGCKSWQPSTAWRLLANIVCRASTHVLQQETSSLYKPYSC